MDIRVCIGSSCHLKGSREVINRLNELIKTNELENFIELKGSFCTGDCLCKGIMIRINETIHSVTCNEVDSFFKNSVLPNLPKAI